MAEERFASEPTDHTPSAYVPAEASAAESVQPGGSGTRTRSPVAGSGKSLRSVAVSVSGRPIAGSRSSDTTVNATSRSVMSARQASPMPSSSPSSCPGFARCVQLSLVLTVPSPSLSVLSMSRARSPLRPSAARSSES